MAWLTPAGTVQVSSTPTGQVTVAVVPINVGDEQGVLVANAGAAAASNPIPTAITAAAAKATMRAQPWTRTPSTEIFEGNPSRERCDDDVDAGDASDTRPTRTESARPLARLMLIFERKPHLLILLSRAPFSPNVSMSAGRRTRPPANNKPNRPGPLKIVSIPLEGPSGRPGRLNTHLTNPSLGEHIRADRVVRSGHIDPNAPR